MPLTQLATVSVSVPVETGGSAILSSIENTGPDAMTPAEVMILKEIYGGHNVVVRAIEREEEINFHQEKDYLGAKYAQALDAIDLDIRIMFPGNPPAMPTKHEHFENVVVDAAPAPQTEEQRLADENQVLREKLAKMEAGESTEPDMDAFADDDELLAIQHKFDKNGWPHPPAGTLHAYKVALGKREKAA